MSFNTTPMRLFVYNEALQGLALADAFKMTKPEFIKQAWVDNYQFYRISNLYAAAVYTQGSKLLGAIYGVSPEGLWLLDDHFRYKTMRRLNVKAHYNTPMGTAVEVCWLHIYAAKNMLSCDKPFKDAFDPDFKEKEVDNQFSEMYGL